MFKYFVTFIKIGWYLIFAYPKLLIYSLFKKHISFERRYNFAIRFFRMLEYGFGFKYDIKGLENIKDDEHICLCPNHQAFLDPLVISTHEMLKRKFLIVAKKESAKMIYVGRIEKMMDVMFIDREDFRKSLITMKECSQILKEGNRKDMLIFLEGTRTKNKNLEMNEFKPGGLKPAFENHLTIVPVAMTGYNKVLTGKNNLLSPKIHIEFLEPLRYEDYKDMNTIQVSQLLHEKISSRVKEMVEMYN